mgnify:CR=1 FL=1
MRCTCSVSTFSFSLFLIFQACLASYSTPWLEQISQTNLLKRELSESIDRELDVDAPNWVLNDSDYLPEVSDLDKMDSKIYSKHAPFFQACFSRPSDKALINQTMSKAIEDGLNDEALAPEALDALLDILLVHVFKHPILLLRTQWLLEGMISLGMNLEAAEEALVGSQWHAVYSFIQNDGESISRDERRKLLSLVTDSETRVKLIHLISLMSADDWAISALAQWEDSKLKEIYNHSCYQKFTSPTWKAASGILDSMSDELLSATVTASHAKDVPALAVLLPCLSPTRYEMFFRAMSTLEQFQDAVSQMFLLVNPPVELIQKMWNSTYVDNLVRQWEARKD